MRPTPDARLHFSLRMLCECALITRIGGSKSHACLPYSTLASAQPNILLNASGGIAAYGSDSCLQGTEGAQKSVAMGSRSLMDNRPEVNVSFTPKFQLPTLGHVVP